MAETKKDKKADKKGKMKLRSISIRPIESGFLGSAGYERVRDEDAGKGELCCSPWEPDKEYALADQAAIHKFIDSAFGFSKKNLEKLMKMNPGRS